MSRDRFALLYPPRPPDFRTWLNFHMCGTSASFRPLRQLRPRHQQIPDDAKLPGRSRHDGGTHQPCRAGVHVGPFVPQLGDLRWHARAVEELDCGQVEIRLHAVLSLVIMPAATTTTMSAGAYPGPVLSCAGRRV